jgi:hypothetical protein
MSLVKLVENSNLDNLYNKPEYHMVSKVFFLVQEHRSHRHFIVEIKDHMIH